MEIRKYESTDEKGWVRCRVLSYLDTAYYDDVHREKERFENPSIELVAIEEDQVVGLIDIEYDTEDDKICSEEGTGGMIWHLAVHPDFQGQGIGKALMENAVEEAIKLDLEFLEAWTRDAGNSAEWFEKNAYRKVDEYYHLYLSDEDMAHNVEPDDKALHPLYMFAEYTGSDIEQFDAIERKYKCMCYIRNL